MRIVQVVEEEQENMSAKFDISFANSASLENALTVMLQASGDAKAVAGASEADPGGVIERAAKIAGFSAKSMTTLDVIAPQGSAADRLLVIGIGKPSKLVAHDWLRAGGTAAAHFKKADKVVVYLDAPGVEVGAQAAADFALGLLLRAYSFDAYKTKKKSEDEKTPKKVEIIIVTAAHQEAEKAFAVSEAVAGGVILARDLVNLPPNVLGPVEFAEKAEELRKLGVEVEVLGEKELKKLGMNALLGVAQGSARPPRLAVMQWNGGSKRMNPLPLSARGSFSIPAAFR